MSALKQLAARNYEDALQVSRLLGTNGSPPNRHQLVCSAGFRGTLPESLS